MADDFSSHEEGLNSPADNAAVITPNDSADISKTSRALYIGGAGNIKVDMTGGQDAVLFSGIPAGTILPIRVDRVYSTDTTATLIVALW